MTPLQIVGVLMLIFGTAGVTIIASDRGPLKPAEPPLKERIGEVSLVIGGFFLVFSVCLWFGVGFLLLAAQVSVS